MSDITETSISNLKRIIERLEKDESILDSFTINRDMFSTEIIIRTKDIITLKEMNK